jgi:hypothetical protein
VDYNYDGDADGEAEDQAVATRVRLLTNLHARGGFETAQMALGSMECVLAKLHIVSSGGTRMSRARVPSVHLTTR